jgi:putative transposase
MPWMESPMEHRLAFIAALQTSDETFSELCARFGVSRKTGYKWRGRFEEEGRAGLRDRPRLAHDRPHRLSAEVEELIVALRRAKPHEGPKKLRLALGRRHPDVTLPAVSTIGEVLCRHGLIESRPRRRRLAGPSMPSLRAEHPNDVWCADFKGDRRLGNGQRCYPLTISDAKTRFLVDCRALRSTESRGALAVFEAAFRAYGLPSAIRTDNGVPFAHPNALAGLSALSVRWMKLDIAVQRIEPGKPQQNGRHERMHGTLERRRDIWPKRNFAEQQRAFDAFRFEYNHDRPHEALAMAYPATLYEPSARPYPEKLAPPSYASTSEVRRVDSNGCVKWRGRPVFVATALTDEIVALDPIDDGRWAIFFRHFPLACFDEKTQRLVELPDEALSTRGRSKPA